MCLKIKFKQIWIGFGLFSFFHEKKRRISVKIKHMNFEWNKQGMWDFMQKKNKPKLLLATEIFDMHHTHLVLHLMNHIVVGWYSVWATKKNVFGLWFVLHQKGSITFRAYFICFWYRRNCDARKIAFSSFNNVLYWIHLMVDEIRFTDFWFTRPKCGWYCRKTENRFMLLTALTIYFTTLR